MKNTQQNLDGKTTAPKSIIYNPSQPITVIFNAINELDNYTFAADDELTEIKKINLALININKQRILKDNIHAWKFTTQVYKN